MYLWHLDGAGRRKQSPCRTRIRLSFIVNTMVADKIVTQFINDHGTDILISEYSDFSTWKFN